MKVSRTASLPDGAAFLSAKGLSGREVEIACLIMAGEAHELDRWNEMGEKIKSKRYVTIELY